MIEELKKTSRLAIGVGLLLHFTACGTVMHPERKGQKDGQIDIGVAILDGLGLLFFIIPGVISYAVDFSNGTIYLPKGGKTSMEMKGLRRVRFDPKHCDVACVEKIIRTETGYAVKFNQRDLRVSRMSSIDEMLARFAEDGDIRLARR